MSFKVDQLDDLDIYAPKGTLVVVTDTTAKNGYATDKIMVEKYLKRNTPYEIERTVVAGWSTAVFLKHLPSMSFNSSMFMQILD